MYYVITDNGVKKGKAIREINVKVNGKIEENEFKQLGPDKVVKITMQDLEFIQDKKRMSLIPIRNLYKKENTVKLMVGIMMLLQVIALVKK